MCTGIQELSTLSHLVRFPWQPHHRSMIKDIKEYEPMTNDLKKKSDLAFFFLKTDRWARPWRTCIRSTGSRKDCTEAFLSTTSAVCPPRRWPSPHMSSWSRSSTSTSTLFSGLQPETTDQPQCFLQLAGFSINWSHGNIVFVNCLLFVFLFWLNNKKCLCSI